MTSMFLSLIILISFTNVFTTSLFKPWLVVKILWLALICVRSSFLSKIMKIAYIKIVEIV